MNMNVSEITGAGWEFRYAGVLSPETILLKERIERIAKRCLVDEVLVTPKPGLVDVHDTGAHDDMDVDTFLASAAAIAPYIAEMYLCGRQWNDAMDGLFYAIAPLGIQAEEAMFRATNGVNTHKGAIFTMGILSAAAGYAHGKCRSESRADALENRILSVLNISGAMMRKPMEESFVRMQKKSPKTHGEKLYARYGEKGIRGEAELGFPIIKDVALPVFSFYMKEFRPSGEILDDPVQNAININVLLQIMTKLSDTCVISRGGPESLFWVQEKAAEVTALGGAFTDEGMQTITAWNRECIERNISPGGAADILSATLFLWRVESDAAIKSKWRLLWKRT